MKVLESDWSNAEPCGIPQIASTQPLKDDQVFVLYI